MFNKTKIAAAALLLTATMGAQAQAAEVSVSNVVTFMVSQAVEATKAELGRTVETAVIQTAHVFTLEDEAPQTAKVTITDIESEEAENDAE